jgi:hypothetical protein
MGGNTAAADHAQGPQPRRPRWGWSVLLRLGLSIALAMALLTPLPGSQAWAWSLPALPRAQQSQGSARTPLAPSAPTGRLQESAPPAAVQQLQQALAEHLPQVEILSPRDGALLSEGPWALRVRVSDWPMADAGELGLGAHLMVQVDQQPAVALVGPAEALELELPALAPGSHRITVYAAKPWGEAVKSPGAIRQIRVHRVAANPLGLPIQGSPQLLAVSPVAAEQAEPILLDWILLDAPLQNLRPGDGSWRLRVSVNGDSFLLDQNVPLWLRGWRPGANSLLLELVDGLGEPLNPPFNSLVREVRLPSTGGTSASPKPRWLGGRLNDQELDLLLGRITPADLAANNAGEPTPPADDPEDPSTGAVIQPEPTILNNGASEPAAGGVDTTESESEPAPAVQAVQNEPMDDQATAAQTQPESEPETEPEAADAWPLAARMPEAEPELTPAAGPDEAGSNLAPERITSSTPLNGTARELVNADGSLIKPKPAGPLAGLRQQLSP